MSSGKPTPNKRDDIIQAALELFGEHGIRATTTRDIAARAGITEGAIYRHFPSKEGLASSIFLDCMHRLLAHLQAAAAEGTTPGDRLCSTARAFFDFAENTPAAYNYIMMSHQDDLPALMAQEIKPKDVFAQAIADGMAAGEFRRMDVQLATGFVVGMCIRTMWFWNAGVLDLPRNEVGAELCDAIHRILAP